MTHPYLALTDDDREEMLRTIGVSSVDELFRDIPAGVRFDRALDLEPALSEQELSAHLGELAARNVDTTRELSFLGAGIYDHYVPAVVDAVLQRGEFLTAYTPYQPEMSQGVLQAIFEYQTAICELTGMDVSNASGYDGTTVAADACYIAKHATGQDEDRRHRGDEPAGAPGREDVRARLRARGRRGAAPRRHDRPGRACAQAAEGAAAVIFQQPNFFGCLEPAPELAAAANDAEALSIAHVDPLSLGVLEAPGRYGCAIALGEGQAAGNFPAFGGPHYGFLAARQDFIRRMPGRIVGETVDAAGERGYVLTLQTREQHIRREKATSNITTNQTLLALGGLVYLTWLGPQGLRELGETCLSLSAYAKQQLRERPGSSCVFPDRATFKEFAVRVGRNAREVVAAARERGVHPGYALGRDYEGMDDVLLVAVTEKRTPAEIDRLAEVLAEVTRDEADLREVAGRAAARRRSRTTRACRRAEIPEELRRSEPPRLPEVPEFELIRHFTELSTRNFGIDNGFYPLGSCTMKYNPRINERLVALPGLREPPSAAGRGRRAGRARARVAAAGDPRRGDGPRTPCRCSRPPARRAS